MAHKTKKRPPVSPDSSSRDGGAWEQDYSAQGGLNLSVLLCQGWDLIMNAWSDIETLNVALILA